MRGQDFAPLGKGAECPASSYLCLTPTADFQKKALYTERMGSLCLRGYNQPLSKLLKTGCNRHSFAQMVRKEAMKLGYPSLVTDGSQSENQTAEEVARLLKLSNKKIE